MSEKQKIDIISRAVILDETGEKMLFCAPKDKRYYYLPGGHVEFGETAKEALKRELLEETGIKISADRFSFAGADENIFMQSGEKQHEVNFYFSVDERFSDREIIAKEDHLTFSWIPLSETYRFPIFPESVKRKCEEFAKEGIIAWNDA